MFYIPSIYVCERERGIRVLLSLLVYEQRLSCIIKQFQRCIFYVEIVYLKKFNKCF
jgi:hypothetical protein